MKTILELKELEGKEVGRPARKISVFGLLKRNGEAYVEIVKLIVAKNN